MAKEYVTAPMPGVFYRRPDPDDPEFVVEGDEVEEGDVVALVGVMKNFHDVKSEFDGVVTEILVEEEEAIEAGDKLIELDVE